MNININSIISQINVSDYTMTITVPENGSWISYRYPPSPFTASMCASRYNYDNESAFYLASSIQCAQAEVGSYESRDLYRVTPMTIMVFDTLTFAKDFSLTEQLTACEHDFCQDLAACLTTTHGVTGFLYPSRQMLMRGQMDFCIALRPQAFQLVDGRLEIFNPTEGEDGAQCADATHPAVVPENGASGIVMVEAGFSL